MQAVEGVGLLTLRRYLRSLSKSGFQTVKQTKIGKNLFLRLCAGTDTLRLSFSGKEKLLLLETDPDGVTTEDFSASGREETRRAEFYLYGLNMDPGGYNPNGQPDSHLNTTGLPNCGQILAIRGKDNSVIIIDGGLSSQWKDGALDEFEAFLHRVTDTPAGKNVTISCWILTHFHSDHMDGFLDLLSACSERLTLERILCNLPTLSDYPRANNLNRMRELARLIREKYPNCKEMKTRTGESVRIGGVTLQTFYTHTDADWRADRRVFRDSNDTSLAIRASADGMSWMILGDISKIAEERILARFSTKELKSDLVQVAHHCFNPLGRIYGAINAPVACFTQTEKGTVKNDFLIRNSDLVKAYSKNLYFSGDGSRTVGFATVNGALCEIYRGNGYLPIPKEI